MRDLKAIVEASSLSLTEGSFLDFGAGIGTSVPFFRKYFPSAHLTCVDVSKKSLEIAAVNHADKANYVTFDGKNLPFADNSFDVAYACCVFRHISPLEHIKHLTELRRVLKQYGILMIYEHNPLNPLTVRAVNSCPFDENAELIRPGTMHENFKSAGFLSPSIHYRVFFPRFFRMIRMMETWLTWLPLGAQYYVMSLKDE